MYLWNIIGEQLGVSYGDIESANNIVPNNDTTKLSKILQMWMDKVKSSPVCWRTIITVIENAPVENKVVADNMYCFLSTSSTQNEYLSCNQPGIVKTLHLTIVPVSFYRSK